jgi:hypothetical protein
VTAERFRRTGGQSSGNTRLAINIVLVGSVSPTEFMPMDPELIVRRLLTVTGMHNHTAEHLTTTARSMTERWASHPFRERAPRFALGSALSIGRSGHREVSLFVTSDCVTNPVANSSY